MAGTFQWACWLDASLMIVLLSLHQLCAGESISGSLPVPTPSPSPLLQEYTVEFTVQTITLHEWANISLVFKETVATEATTYCSAYRTECNLVNATLNFTASEVDVLSLGVSGPSLELAVVVYTASSMLSQEALAAILQRAANAIYQATGKIITGITPTPPSASLLPVSTPYPPTQDSGGGILSFLPNALTSLPLPMLIGVIAAGVTLLFIIIIFLISTTVIIRERCNKSRVRRLNLKQVKPAHSSTLDW